MTTIKSLCVFCGSSAGKNPQMAEMAGRLGALMAGHGISLVYGGGNVGLMGRVAEGVLSNGGHVTGVIPEHLLKMEVGHTGLSELVVVDSMHSRKARMFELADAFAVLPGGLGTLDETFEILTWKQLGLHGKPVVLIDAFGFWTPLVAMIDAMIEAGFVAPRHRDLYVLAERVEDVIPLALASQTPSAVSRADLF
ncbi:MAG: TIGR00730 family Rossman fold protein [Alphaproteobacteria bacterium]|nr:TIGR00730 family Rossman fold protein [Alphaproteobacteria bacterium]